MKQQNKLTFFIALAVTVFAALACGNLDKKDSAGTSDPRPASTDSRPADPRSPSTENASSNQSGSSDLSSPTKSHAAMYQAMKSRDIAAYKKTVADCYFETVAAYAKRQNISPDEFIKNSLELVPAASIREPEVRNEKISGNTATLEEKDFTGDNRWNSAPYVKENGDWKFSGLCFK